MNSLQTARLWTITRLIYLDPLYYVKGKDLYENHYRHDDHARIAKRVSTIQQRWIVSYDNVEPIRTLCSAFQQTTFGFRYSARERCVGNEVMVFCDRLAAPGLIEPSRAIAA